MSYIEFEKSVNPTETLKFLMAQIIKDLDAGQWSLQTTLERMKETIDAYKIHVDSKNEN